MLIRATFPISLVAKTMKNNFSPQLEWDFIQDEMAVHSYHADDSEGKTRREKKQEDAPSYSEQDTVEEFPMTRDDYFGKGKIPKNE